MKSSEIQKPEFEQWLVWSRILVDRLSICVDIYSAPPNEDIFMPEKDRHARKLQTIELLKSIYAITDGSERSSDALDELNQHAERVIDGLALVFRSALLHLPQLSRDMQRLLKSPWQSKFPGRLAENLFRGSMGDDQEGLGSGLPEHGRMPAALQNLLAVEEKGGNRSLREEILDKHLLQDDLPRRWSQVNSRALRQAGRIE